MSASRFTSILLPLLTLPFLLFAAVPREPVYTEPRGYVCYRTTTPIVIDGKLDDAAWRACPWTEDFVDIEGEAKPRPRFRTRAKMCWDEQFFYVAAELEEPHVWATLKEHDSIIFQDPDFEVFINPKGDSHDYCEFEMNALNTTWDLLLTKPYKDGGLALNAWEIPGLKSAVHVDGTLNEPRDQDAAWSLEIAFPWKVLGELTDSRLVPPKDGDNWRVNFSRVEWRIEIKDGKYVKVPKTKEDNWSWSPQGVIDMHRPERWGYVQFSTAEPGTAKFVPDPSEPVRRQLHRVYYAQRTFFGKEKRWAKTLDELGLGALGRELKLEATTSGFEVTSGPWHLREDARIWKHAAGSP
jgi:cellulose/xylan binding protein with CBM9 domain